VRRDARGAFNIGPPDWMTITEIARATNRRALRLPFWVMRLLAPPVRLFRAPRYRLPRGFLEYIRYPWVVAPKRLQDELGFRFRYSSGATLHEIVGSLA
jgi:hypothetical protein